MEDGGGEGSRASSAQAQAKSPSFQNGSQGDFPTSGRAEPLKRKRIRLQPQLGPWREKPRTTTVGSEAGEP